MIELRFRALKDARFTNYVLRFVFGGCCTAIAGMVAKRYGPAVGGLFLAFPAIFPAGASLIESHERKRKSKVGADGTHRGRMAAAIDASGAALGCCGLAAFALVVWKVMPRIGGAKGLPLAIIVWTVVALLLWQLRKRRIFGLPP